MGLLDILNGMQNGPHGQSQTAPSGGSGGMSPIMMGLLALLAYKAIKGGGLENILGGGQPSRPAPMPGGSVNADGSGGLGDLLGGILGGGRPGGGGIGDLLGGLLGSGAAGSVLSSGLGNVLKDIQNSGHGRAAQSWVGTGRNEEIAPDDLAKALGADTIDALTAQTGLPRNELLAGLSQHLPELVDQLTPKGQLPTKEEASRW